MGKVNTINLKFSVRTQKTKSHELIENPFN